MLNNKAFTLIELLAVIAILAIILLIAVPNVISIIEKTKKAAFEKSAYFLVDAAEKNHAKAIVNNEEGEYEYYFKDGIQYAADGNEIEFEGKVPENGIIQISEEGKVTMAIHDGTYCACKDSNLDIVEVEEKVLDECTADRVVLEDGTWDEIADKYNIPKEVLLEYNDVDESVDPSTIDIKIPINVTGTTTLQELATYKTYYSIGYVLSNDTFPKTFSYTIELDNLPVEIEDITQIEVEEEQIITQIEDFRSYIVKRNMGDVVYGEGDNLYYDLETADIFKEHSVTSDNMTINNISVTCTTSCEATISVTVNNINDIVPIEMNGSNIIYTPVMFTVEFNGDLLLASLDLSGASAPEMSSNMIPIYFDSSICSNGGNDCWKKADQSNLNSNYQWYNYTNKMWANAVTVKEIGTVNTREYYQNAPLGTTINDDDILTFMVWIPRYKYKIPAGTGARTIDIIFEDKDTPESGFTTIEDTAKNTYYTHPAFTFGDTKLNGIWVGKFEATGNSEEITSKPSSVVFITSKIANQFNAVKTMELENNIYGYLNSEVDMHLIKNNEWGAITYLAYSEYGFNQEVWINPIRYYDSSYQTGRAGLGPSVDYTLVTAKYNLVDETKGFGPNASTTGNVYGIYDMSGGRWESVMANYQNKLGLSTFEEMPDSKYYNYFGTNTSSTACNLGICYGQALSGETAGWNNDFSLFSENALPWLIRGGCYYDKTKAGIFAYHSHDGGNYGYGNLAIRIIQVKK